MCFKTLISCIFVPIMIVLIAIAGICALMLVTFNDWVGTINNLFGTNSSDEDIYSDLLATAEISFAAFIILGIVLCFCCSCSCSKCHV